MRDPCIDVMHYQFLISHGDIQIRPVIFRIRQTHPGHFALDHGLQAPGADGRTVPLRTIGEMVELYLREILELEPNGPYFLVGVCAGGLIAHELACALQARGRPVGLLVLAFSG